MTVAPAGGGPASATCCAPSVGVDPLVDAERLAVIAAALSSPLRIRIMDVLRRTGGQVCQCELLALFGIGQSLLSHHMKKLVDAGLVHVERRHRWAWYSVSADTLEEISRWLTS